MFLMPVCHTVAHAYLSLFPPGALPLWTKTASEGPDILYQLLMVAPQDQVELSYTVCGVRYLHALFVYGSRCLNRLIMPATSCDRRVSLQASGLANTQRGRFNRLMQYEGRLWRDVHVRRIPFRIRR